MYEEHDGTHNIDCGPRNAEPCAPQLSRHEHTVQLVRLVVQFNLDWLFNVCLGRLAERYYNTVEQNSCSECGAIITAGKDAPWVDSLVAVQAAKSSYVTVQNDVTGREVGSIYVRKFVTRMCLI